MEFNELESNDTYWKELETLASMKVNNQELCEYHNQVLTQAHGQYAMCDVCFESMAQAMGYE